MSKRNKQEWLSFTDTDGRWMICRVCQSEYVKVDENITATTCHMCVQKRCLSKMPLEEMMPSLNKKPKTGRPAGWHWMTEFVDKDGTVYHKGKEQPELKGTLKPTKVKPPKKRKKLTKDEKLYKRISDYKKKQKAKRRAKK